MAQPSPLGAVTLVTGPEEFLNERVVAAARAAARRADPAADVTPLTGDQVTGAAFDDLTAPSLFSATRVVVVRRLEELPDDVHDRLLDYARAPEPDVALVLVHSGGPRGTGLLAKLRSLPSVTEHRSERLRGAALPQFVRDEARAHGTRFDNEAVALLVDAVGEDLRGLGSAVAQLCHDFPGEELTAEVVGRYFSGRADVRGYVIADLALQGRTAQALAELRWGLATGLSGAAITGSFAAAVRGLARVKGARSGMRDADLARDAGVPPFKVGQLRRQARAWEEGRLGDAIRSVARADAEVKGAGADEAYALERMVLAVAGAAPRG